MIALVSTGIIYGYGFKHIPKVVFYTAIFTIAYLFFYHKMKNKAWEGLQLPFLSESNRKNVELLLVSFIVVFCVYHFLFLGHVPVISAYNSEDYYGIAFMRQDINNHSNVFIKYVSSFMLKGIMPFALLYFYISNKKYFWVLFPIVAFYSLALMQKSLIVSVLIPLIIYLLIKRKYIGAVACSFTAVLGVYILVYVTNPEIRFGSKIKTLALKDEQGNEQGNVNPFISASGALYERVLFTTGKVSGHWFEMIPSKYPYSKGCGYHFIAPFLGCDFDDYDYSRIIYEEVYKKESKIGLKGTVTVMNFVYDYANFGYFGLFYSGVIVAFFFAFINKLFNDSFTWTLCLNALFVFWLSSSAFHTLLLSGGWLITLILFFIFKKYITVKENELSAKN